ncbi:Hypothetical protein CINCED_3A010956 [Cinara cedri]|nr:Hypothetical protein CINCED_3A010956 [Cinara cedri]
MTQMAGGVAIDLYADDLEQDFAQEDFAENDNVDLYDDDMSGISIQTRQPVDRSPNMNTKNSSSLVTNGSSSSTTSNNSTSGRRYQLYIGNLTWWTTDQDITDSIMSIGVTDFIEVKFFENRGNGQSKGFCVVTLGSERSLRLVMDRLPKKELHGQSPVVTYPTKQALLQFESQSKTRPLYPTHIQNMPIMGGMVRPLGGQVMQQPMRGGPMMPQSQGMRNRIQGMQQSPQGMQPPMGMTNGHRIPLQPGGHMNIHQSGPPGPPGYQNQWNGSNQQMGPLRSGMQPQGPVGQPRGPPPGMFLPGQGPPRIGPHQGPQGSPGPGGPRGDWNRPPGMPTHHMAPPGTGFSSHQQGPMQGPPGQGPVQMMQGGPGLVPAPAPHVNPAFFTTPSGASQGPPSHHSYGSPNLLSSRPYMSNEMGMPEQELEEIMNRNRTVSSSAIARAVADAAAGEFSNAIETLVTAISLIKQSKVASDERCKILVSSLQDTLHGIESKSYSSRRERSRSPRDRAHRRSRRERTRSRERDYRDRSRDHEREKDRDKYVDRYYTSDRDGDRDRERERDREYREKSHEDSSAKASSRSRKVTPPDVTESVTVSSKSRYYEDRYRERDRERDRERERERERESTSSRRPVDSDRDIDRDRREDRAGSSHRSSRH